MSWTAARAEEALVRAGLDPARFDLEATAAELQERSTLNDSLDPLVGHADHLDAGSGFDARWGT